MGDTVSSDTQCELQLNTTAWWFQYVSIHSSSHSRPVFHRIGDRVRFFHDWGNGLAELVQRLVILKI